jgi:hypothetical protein
MNDTRWSGRGAVALLLMVVGMGGCQKRQAVAFLAVTPPVSEKGSGVAEDGRWLAGDFHNHTFLTDGDHTPETVFAHAFAFGLDWIANSEHGGDFARNASGSPWPDSTVFLGEPPAGRMWRWQSLWRYSYPRVAWARQTWPDKIIVQGYEWNVPGHDHASVAIVGAAEEGGLAIARHAYLFDEKDSGSTATEYLRLDDHYPQKMMTNTHEKAVAGVKWLAQAYPRNSYMLINHPSRWQNYSIAAIRDLQEAAPTVAFGFEGMPGHQKAVTRGHYDGGPFFDSSGRDVSFRAQTYGGADFMLARIGGLWDALLGEGRRFFVFVNSDFHAPAYDFWPGEYAKNYTWVRDLDKDGSTSAEEIVAGLRSGNSFVVHGDLIDGLDFSLECREAPEKRARMGETLAAQDDCTPQVRLRFSSPARNRGGRKPVVDRVDLIMGAVTGRISKTLADGVTANPEYDREVNDSAKVVASFSVADWQEELGPDGRVWRSVLFPLPSGTGESYYRLRGTNVGKGVAGETDAAGNPLSDALLWSNNADKAYADLWFYSNPVFLRLKH